MHGPIGAGKAALALAFSQNHSRVREITYPLRTVASPSQLSEDVGYDGLRIPSVRLAFLYVQLMLNALSGGFILVSSVESKMACWLGGFSVKDGMFILPGAYQRVHFQSVSERRIGYGSCRIIPIYGQFGSRGTRCQRWSTALLTSTTPQQKMSSGVNPEMRSTTPSPFLP